MKEIDYLIVGQGLAGSILAFELLVRDRKVIVIDKKENNKSSAVAAGLYNPITGRKMVKTWRAADLFPYLTNFYSELQDILRDRFFHPMPIYRPFISWEENNIWQGRSQEEQYSDFVEKVLAESFHGAIDDPYGGILLDQCGYVDVKKLIKNFRTYFESKEVIQNTRFDFEKVRLEEETIFYEDWKPKKIIFAIGAQSHTHFNHFNWLPFTPVKGEILTLQTEENLNFILNRGVFMIPIGDNIFRAGATYNWKNIEPGTTKEAASELLEKIRTVFKGELTIIDHSWGLRPATKDRRPIIGEHPQHPDLLIFGGFGSKGVSLIPFWAKEFVDFLESGKNLDPEIDIKRFYSLY